MCLYTAFHWGHDASGLVIQQFNGGGTVYRQLYKPNVQHCIGLKQAHKYKYNVQQCNTWYYKINGTQKGT